MRRGKKRTPAERAAWRQRQERRQLRRDRENDLWPHRERDHAAVTELQRRRRDVVQLRRAQLGALAHRRGGR